MSSRNVIITLVVVIAMIVFIIFKIRLEPKRKLDLNRNASQIKYSQIAMCRMDCENISANDITEVLRKGEINKNKSDRTKKPCAIFTILGKTKKGIGITIVITQCGKGIRVTNCYRNDGAMPCNCVENSQPVSFIKLKLDAPPA
jgi:hypothetical protein